MTSGSGLVEKVRARAASGTFPAIGSQPVNPKTSDQKKRVLVAPGGRGVLEVRPTPPKISLRTDDIPEVQLIERLQSSKGSEP